MASTERTIEPRNGRFETPSPRKRGEGWGEGISTARARKLRRMQTDAECKLWQRLRDRRLSGHKFRRQHPIGHYFADFACVERRVVVELDGASIWSRDITTVVA